MPPPELYSCPSAASSPASCHHPRWAHIRGRAGSIAQRRWSPARIPGRSSSWGSRVTHRWQPSHTPRRGKARFSKDKTTNKNVSEYTHKSLQRTLQKGSARGIQEPVTSLDHIPSTPQLIAMFIFSSWSRLCGSAFGQRGCLYCF